MNGIFESNTWVVPLAPGDGALLVDPGLDLPAVDAALSAAGLRPAAVLCTHGHFDHVGSAGEFQRRHGVPVLLHRADEKTARGANFLMMAFGVPARVELPRFDLVDDGTVAAGGVPVRFRHTPGHTAGSCVLEFGGFAFTGDTLYRDGVGLVKLPGEDPRALRRSIRALWQALPDDTEVCPGHGGAATFGVIKRENLALGRFLAEEEVA